MYQKEDWVELIKPYEIQLNPTTKTRLNQGEKAKVEEVKEEGFWINFFHKELQVYFSNSISEHYIRLVKY